MAKEEDVGVVGGVNAPLPILMTMAAFLSIALYNVIELTFLIFGVFKKRNGLYFWSFVVATWGIAPHAVGFILKFFQVTTLDLLSAAIIGVGWACMVIGQSVVLYSRLHLVIRDRSQTRWVLYMIIFDAIVLGIPLFVLAMGANSQHSVHFLPGFLVYDKVQLVVISVQETIISVIYIYETIRLLGHDTGTNGRGPLQKLLRHLILVNVVVLMLDITLLAVQFSGHFEIQTTYKTAVYSVKLKIEFSVLNRLVSIVEHKDQFGNRGTPDINTISLGPWAKNGKPGAFSKIEATGSSGDLGTVGGTHSWNIS
ncbi:integral membrane [Pyrenophora seminiperda CCB06]|uniref:Integral membrane n=1 Tax=Pyrenophora seminiperda CCB06 TaxID=1302712 RepID=A0A3M7M1B7_9PLEO|nr:integral membrane [Pyrenophora seminiperda CCB06]